MSGSSHFDSLDWKPGQIILENYIVREILGTGGFGKVYLVEAENRPGTLFAVKTLRYQKGKMKKNTETLLSELQAWSDIPPHPNIVTCRFFRSIEQTPVIFSEYIDGGTIKDWIRLGKIKGLVDLLDIAIQIVEGLRIAHNRGLIHQDIKSANILMSSDGCAKITDFGLACYSVSDCSDSSDSQSASTDSSRTYKGLTPVYCSPEQAARFEIDHRTDIWSWALVVIEMLLQDVPPWAHGSVAGCWYETAPAPSAHSRFHSNGLTELWGLLGRCLKEDPEERPDNCNNLQERLLDIYRLAAGTDYPRAILDIGRPQNTQPAEFRRRTIYSGVDWEPPYYYLQKVCELINANPDSQVRIPPVTGHTRRACMLAEARGFQRVMNWMEAVRGYIAIPEIDNLYIQMLMDCSQIYFDLDDINTSIAISHKAARLLESDACIISDLKRREFMIKVAVNISEAYRVTGRFDDAQVILGRLGAAAGMAIPDDSGRWQDIDPDNGDDAMPAGMDPVLVARYHRVWGNLYMGLQKSDWALARYLKALDLMEKYDIEDIVNASYRKTMCLQAIGMMLSNSGRPLEARDYMERAVAMSRDWSGADSHDIYCLAVIHANMGNLLNKLNHPDTLMHLEKAVNFAMERSSEDMRFVRLLSRTMLSKAGYYSRNLDYANSLMTLKQLIALLDEHIYVHGRTELMLEQLAVSNNLVAVLLKLQRFDDAIRAIHHGCRLAEHLQRSARRDDVTWVEMTLRFNLVSALNETGQYAEALSEIDRVIAYRGSEITEESRKHAEPALANAINQKVVILRKLERFTEALDASKGAVEHCGVIDHTSNWDHLIIKLGILETYCNCLYDLGMYETIERVADDALMEIERFDRLNERTIGEINRAELELYKADCLIRRGERAAGLDIARRVREVVSDHTYHRMPGIGRKIDMTRQIIESAG
ncbi:serine/threonine protein kinase [bacterium]|nr:serine/threonine protein kinase [candidate division CSSED10-310 bacterium]